MFLALNLKISSTVVRFSEPPTFFSSQLENVMVMKNAMKTFLTHSSNQYVSVWKQLSSSLRTHCKYFASSCAQLSVFLDHLQYPNLNLWCTPKTMATFFLFASSQLYNWWFLRIQWKFWHLTHISIDFENFVAPYIFWHFKEKVKWLKWKKHVILPEWVLLWFENTLRL